MNQEHIRAQRFKNKTERRILQKIGTMQDVPVDYRVSLHPMLGDYSIVNYPDANYKGPPIETIEVINETKRPILKRTKKC
jgi:hypothetical protein